MKRLFFVFGSLLVVGSLSSCQDKDSYDGHYGLAFTVIGIILLLFLVLGIYTNMLRDEISDCDVFDANALAMQKKQKTPLLNKDNPFSLAKVQFAAWTVVIASSYIYLSLCKGDCSEGGINKTALVLMGIGAGIVTATAIIDKREMQDDRPRHQNHPSQGFFVDILSDDNGISIHRFQNFVWTAIAMVVYITKVCHVQSGCVLPEVSDTLLALTGISGATYLTLRAGENKPSAQEAQDKAD